MFKVLNGPNDNDEAIVTITSPNCSLIELPFSFLFFKLSFLAKVENE